MTTDSTPQSLPLWPAASQIAAQGDNSCAIESGAVWCVGDNTHGQIGIGTTSLVQLQPAEAELPTGNPAVGIDVGNEFVCAVLQDGSVWCWGQGSSGQYRRRSLGG